MDELRALRLFAKVSVLGSFQRVAADEGITAQAVGKTIRQLEEHLGVRVLHRTTRRCSLTQEGQALLELTQGPLDDLGRALNRVQASSRQVAGLLRISVAPSARHVLAEPLVAFCNHHPRVQVELVAANTFADTVAQQVDVGFRSGHEPQGELVARRLFAVRQHWCASPAYLARHGTPDSAAALRGHRLTGFREERTGRLWSSGLPDGALPYPTFSTNDPETEAALVRAGAGIGLLDAIIAGDDLRAGRLVVVLPEVALPILGFYLYYPGRKRLPQRTRALIDFMVAHFSGRD